MNWHCKRGLKMKGWSFTFMTNKLAIEIDIKGQIISHLIRH